MWGRGGGGGSSRWCSEQHCVYYLIIREINLRIICCLPLRINIACSFLCLFVLYPFLAPLKRKTKLHPLALQRVCQTSCNNSRTSKHVLKKFVCWVLSCVHTHTNFGSNWAVVTDTLRNDQFVFLHSSEA